MANSKKKSKLTLEEQVLIVAAGFIWIVCFLVGGSSNYSKWPAEIQPAWIVALIFIWTGLIVVFAGSRACRTRGVRVTLGAFGFLIAACGLAPLDGYFGSYGDLPWGPLSASIALLVVGGFLCKQRILAVVTLVVAALVLGPGWMAAAPLPPGGISRTIDGLTVTLMPRQGQGRDRVQQSWPIRITGSEKDLDRIDFKGVDSEGNVGPFLRVRSYVTAIRPNPDQPGSYLVAFLPRYANRWSPKVTLPVWPSNPVLTLEVPLPKPGETSPAQAVEGSANGVYARVDGVFWPEKQPPGDRRLELSITKRGFSPGGSRGSNFRVLSKGGGVLPNQSVSSAGSGDDSIETISVGRIGPHDDSIFIEFFTEEARAASTLTFSFPPVGIP